MTGALLVATLLAAEAAPPVQVEIAELPAILAAVKAPGAQAVLVNVWATSRSCPARSTAPRGCAWC